MLPTGSLRTLWLLTCGLFLAMVAAVRPAQASEYRQLPPASPTALSDDWLIHDAARNRLIFYLPGYHQPAHAYYQWVRLNHSQPFPLSFAAQPGLSIFIDNQLVFTAKTATTYSLDLAQLLPAQLSAGTHLLAVWQPDGSPALASFSGVSASSASAGQAKVRAEQAQPRLPRPQGQNVYLGFLLVLGLSYGAVRSAYQPGLARIFQIEELFGGGSDQQAFLAKPAFSLLNLLLVLLFALSFALLLTAIHTDLQNLPLLRRFFDVPETAIVGRVVLYTAVITVFIFGKYVYLEVMGYIFGLQPLVNIQYREFLRTTLLGGLFLPLVLLLYLSLNSSYPRTVAWAASAVIGIVLVGTVLRVARTLHQHASLLNLHLFAYLCATEVLPLLVLLKLIVFTY
ncbi:DUF4271 domain-containing protein [Hymenobacter sp. BT770]|uniref:DUF4271 domain-containing protein n=1 Tax=Hymenobacter sp. BT770 TaxID=2886942 RepID=UPI001D11A326|nr:DUF4271 domain-containing protein [Hymenobacter sp. BT770]MCC3153656.1 DUF4271 domain-containing protein [Hymenobacter sp. BT770]MDO3415878.1 DUF4271 domain-containing protein [Hymenobacter sp. BT770]